MQLKNKLVGSSMVLFRKFSSSFIKTILFGKNIFLPLRLTSPADVKILKEIHRSGLLD